MDCPNCGAYNASSAFRCRRCGQVLPAGEDESSSSEEWGPASEPWDTTPEPPEPEPPAGEQNPWAWSEPADDEPKQEEWSHSRREETSYEDPFRSSQAGAPPAYSGSVYSPDVPNYLWPSIGATLCCCAPLGIPAIVYASRVDAFLKNNDRAAAEEASSKAKNWSMAAAGAAALLWIAFLCTGFFSTGA